MTHALKFVFAFALALGGTPLAAQDAVVAPAVAASPAGPFAAAELTPEAQQYRSRSLVIFADSPDNPDYLRQLHLVQAGLADLAERDVVVVLDTDPAAASPWRQRLRPRGFSLVLMDKDLSTVFRKPNPWDVREVSRNIDRLPSRRQELQERFPGR